MFDEDEDTHPYVAVVDDEEQYSIWLAYKPIPAGWRAAGKSGTKQECLDYITDVWTDMRPLSLRTHMLTPETSGGRTTTHGSTAPTGVDTSSPPRNRKSGQV